MIESIVTVIVVGVIVSFLTATVSNVIRADEMRRLNRRLEAFEKSFRSMKEQTAPKEDIVTLRVIDDTKTGREDLPKFGDE